MFYPKLYSDKSVYEYTAVKRWTRKVDVFTKDLLICPIHCHGNHWTLAVVNLLDKRFEYLDSLSGGDGRGASGVHARSQSRSKSVV